MLDDGEDLPDSFVPATPFPSSITFSPATTVAQSERSTDNTLVIVAPKLSFLFDKIDSEVIHLGSIVVKFAAPVAITSDPSVMEQDETKRYFDYETEATDHLGATSGNAKTPLSGAASTIEIPVLYITAARAAIVRLPVLEHLAANVLAQFLATDLTQSVSASTALVLAPVEMSMGLPGVALLKSALLTTHNAARDVVDSLPPPHGLQGGPASALSAFERAGVPSAALVVRSEGSVGHELIDRESVPGYIAILRAAYGLNLSSKSFHESGWGMYI